MVTITNLSKKYYMGKNNVVDALRGISCDIKNGEVWAVVGPQDLEQSTFLNILGGLDRKYDGTVVINGKDIKEYNENYYRRFVVGTISPAILSYPCFNSRREYLFTSYIW
jgi:ABC-type lipoprotein export system ATPase subunit